MIRCMVVGQEAVIVKLGQVEPRVRGRLWAAVKAETINLVREAKLKVSGPVLRVRSNKLRGGINAKFEESESEVTGSAGINAGKAKYPAVHEYGGTFTIREHLRMMRVAFGRPVKIPRKITVRAHSATYLERSYLRSSLRENEARIRAALKNAVATGVKG